MLGNIEGRRRRGQQRRKWLDCITNSIDMSLSALRELVMDSSRSAFWTGRPGMLQSMELQKSDTSEWLNWTELLINNLDEFKDMMLGESIYVKFKNKPNKSIVIEIRRFLSSLSWPAVLTASPTLINFILLSKKKKKERNQKCGYL